MPRFAGKAQKNERTSFRTVNRTPFSPRFWEKMLYIAGLAQKRPDSKFINGRNTRKASSWLGFEQWWPTSSRSFSKVKRHNDFRVHVLPYSFALNSFWYFCKWFSINHFVFNCLHGHVFEVNSPNKWSALSMMEFLCWIFW